MAASLYGGWTASSLTPAMQPVAPKDPGLATWAKTPVPAPSSTGFSNYSDASHDIMSTIFGPNYKSLLGEGDQGSTPDSSASATNEILANAYASGIEAKNKATKAQSDLYASILGRQQSAADMVGSMGVAPWDMANYRRTQSGNALLTLGIPGAAGVARGAASSLIEAPNMIPTAMPRPMNTNASAWLAYPPGI